MFVWDYRLIYPREMASPDLPELYPVGASASIQELSGNVHPTLARLRASEPVSWLPSLGGWLVTDHAMVSSILRNPSTFTVDDPRFTTAMVVGPSMLSLEDEEHDRHRSPFAEAFRIRPVEANFAAIVKTEVIQLVSEMAPDGRADLRVTLAAPLAVRVILRVVGLTAADPNEVLTWYRAIVESVDEATLGNPVPVAGTNAVGALRDQVAAAAQAERGTLLAAVAADANLDDNELFSNAAVLMFGGIETSEAMTANLLWHLLSHPEQLTRLRDDRTLLANAIEESLRLEPAAAVVDRYATERVSLGRAVINKGDLVSCSLAGANRDPTIFDDPDRYDITRPNARKHLAFAVGPHACLGIHLARLETRCALDAVLDRLPNLVLDTSAMSTPEGLVFRKPASIIAMWDTGEAAGTRRC